MCNPIVFCVYIPYGVGFYRFDPNLKAQERSRILCGSSTRQLSSLEIGEVTLRVSLRLGRGLAHR